VKLTIHGVNQSMATLSRQAIKHGLTMLARSSSNLPGWAEPPTSDDVKNALSCTWIFQNVVII
jgi:hypothetical protein